MISSSVWPRVRTISKSLSLVFFVALLVTGAGKPEACRSPLSVLPAAAHPLPQAGDGNGVTVLENAVEYSFAQHVTFTLRATANADIEQLYLFLQAPGDRQTRSETISIHPSQTITVEHTYDVRLSPLPPFAVVDFWWQLEVAGETITIPVETFTYQDNRFRWETLTGTSASGESIGIHWIQGQGNPVFAQTALDTARNGLDAITPILNAPISAVDVYIYDSPHNLNAAMALTGREWAAGQAHPELGVALVAIPPTEGYTTHMTRYIPHEITHLLLYRVVGATGYPFVPEWLDEGLATASELMPTVEYDLALEQARLQGTLIPLETLCTPFSPDYQTALLSYAESGSVVRFILEEYGAQGIRDLLAAYAGGASCSSGVRQALHISLNQLEAAWKTSLDPQAAHKATIREVALWLSFPLFGVLITLLMAGYTLRKP